MEKEFIKLGSIINSEGPIVTLNVLPNGGLKIEAYSNKFQGNLSFVTKFSDTVSYLDSRLSLRELIELSVSRIFSFNQGVEMYRIPLMEVIDSIPFIDILYREVPDEYK